MNKSELVGRVAADAGVSRATATIAVESVFQSVQDALVKGDTVTLVGFGSFCVTDRAARTGRNPNTGEAVKIAAYRLPKFHPASKLKDAVN